MRSCGPSNAIGDSLGTSSLMETRNSEILEQGPTGAEFLEGCFDAWLRRRTLPLGVPPEDSICSPL